MGEKVRMKRPPPPPPPNELFTASTMLCWCLCCSVQGADSLLSQLSWFHVAGFGFFIAASLLQHQSMVLLARLRTGKSGRPLQFSSSSCVFCLLHVIFNEHFLQYDDKIFLFEIYEINDALKTVCASSPSKKIMEKKMSTIKLIFLSQKFDIWPQNILKAGDYFFQNRRICIYLQNMILSLRVFIF